MPIHTVKITQVARVERSILVAVEADTIEDAIEKQQGSDAPSLTNPSWSHDRDDLENEVVEPA